MGKPTVLPRSAIGELRAPGFGGRLWSRKKADNREEWPGQEAAKSDAGADHTAYFQLNANCEAEGC